MELTFKVNKKNPLELTFKAKELTFKEDQKHEHIPGPELTFKYDQSEPLNTIPRYDQ